MALSDNRRLYDISTRLAVYTEGVKVQYSREFSHVLRKVSELLRKLLGRIRYKTLDGLTKAQLNKLIVELRQSQSKIYSEYTTELLAQLREFMAADLEVSRRAWVMSRIELDDDAEDETNIISDESAIRFIIEDNEDRNFAALFGLAALTGENDRIWSQVTNTPIPANGLYLVPFIKGFGVSAQASVENIIRKAWANRMTVDETLQILIGNGSRTQGTSSQVSKINAQAAAVISTSMAHVAATVGAGVMSSVFNRYCWYSVIDNATTPICRHRNRKIFVFGKGPLPPAHINCRSHVAPIASIGDIPEETFYSWLVSQPDAVQNSILSDSGAVALREGRLNAENMKEFESVQPITLAEFRKRIKQILTRRYGVAS